jgi:hypothetical protein
MNQDGLRLLLTELQSDPDRQRRFRAGYTGRKDALDMLRWRGDPYAADHPRHEAEALQHVVHARPGRDPEARRRQQEAVQRLHHLTDPADDAALDEAIRFYLHPTVPPEPPTHPWFLTPVTWFFVGVGLTLIGVAVWALLPRTLGGSTVAAYEPFASSLDILDRPQTGEEKEMGVEFARNGGIDPATVRLIGTHDGWAMYTGIVGGIDDIRPPWNQSGDVCLMVPIHDSSRGDWQGDCVPPELFDRSGVYIDVADVDDEGYTVAFTVAWGPVGNRVHVIDR